MGDLDKECLENTLRALLDDRLHGDVDMTVRLGEGATRARLPPVRGDDAITIRRLRRCWPVILS